MRISILTVLVILATNIMWAQQPKVVDSIFVDPQYREDQFYLSVTYNFLGKKPKEIKQSGFSSGIDLGVIRDFPFNERRNKAFGVGFGVSVNSYNQNMLISKDALGDYSYEIINNNIVTIKRNKFTTYLVELPLQYRWRTSTAKDYEFWRIYTGAKFGYVVYNSSKFRGSMDNIDYSGISDFNKLQYGLTLSAGYSTWNFNVYYGLNAIFKDRAQLNEDSINMNSIKVGLMFYVL